jgi:CBS domain-containing protein
MRPASGLAGGVRRPTAGESHRTAQASVLQLWPNVSPPSIRHRARIDSCIDRYMQKDVVSVERDASLVEIEKLLEARDISSVLVRERGRPIGVVSRTDLLRVARLGTVALWRRSPR